MKRWMLNIKVQDRIPNTEIRRRTKLPDTAGRVCMLKWNWPGHIGGMVDENEENEKIQRVKEDLRQDGQTTSNY